MNLNLKVCLVIKSVTPRRYNRSGHYSSHWAITAHLRLRQVVAIVDRNGQYLNKQKLSLDSFLGKIMKTTRNKKKIFFKTNILGFILE